MKKYLRLFLINFFALWLTASWLEGVNFSGGLQTLAMAGFTLTLADLLLKPLVKILLLPVNLITLGGFRWLANVIILYLVTVFVPQFKITSFTFQRFVYQGFVIPTVHLSLFWAFVLVSLFVSLITTGLLWLAKGA